MLFLKKLHKWLSLLVGLQLLVWLGTGLYFNLMDHQKASGNQYKQTPVVAQVDINRLVEPQLILSQSKQVVSLKQISLLEHPYYLLTHNKGLYSYFDNDYSLVDAYTAEPVVIDETMVRKLAQSSYNGKGVIKNAVKLSPPYEDIPREQNEVWQVNYADYIQTSVYIDAGSGRIIKHSNDDKRFVDIFFMLHFMDYGIEGSFNNVQIIVFSLFTLFFSLTGFIWTFELLFNGQYKIRFSSKKRTLALFDKDLKPIGEFDLATNTNLLDGLIDHDIALSSTCGGGGTCGQCKVRLDSSVKVTSAEHVFLTKEQLQQGYRLACQHDATETKRLTLIDVTKAKKYLLELTHSEFISPYIKELRFKVLGGNKLTYRAGAHMRFLIPAAKGVSIPQRIPEKLKPHWHHIDHLEFEHKACSRNYSLAKGNGQNSGGANELVFTIKIQSAQSRSILPGVGSNYLCNLAQGQTIEALGPFEDFSAKPSSEKPMILIGAGSGMAPLKSLIEEQLNMSGTRNKYKRKIYFFYGARTENDLLYQEKFFELSGVNPNFHYYPVLSRPSEYWTGAKGYVQDLLTSNISKICKIDGVEFYLCGPPEMMNSTIELLKENNIDASDIAFDKFTQ